MRWITVFFLLMCPSYLSAQEWYIPAYYGLWLNEDHPLYSYGIEGPCGPYITLRSNRLPIDQKNLRFGDIVELSSESTLVKVWRAPMDSSPVAVNQDVLTIHLFEPGNNYVYISSSAQISPAFERDEATVSMAACPEVEGMPAIKQHMICTQLIDESTKKARIFAWAPSCT